MRVRAVAKARRLLICPSRPPRPPRRRGTTAREFARVAGSPALGSLSPSAQHDRPTDDSTAPVAGRPADADPSVGFRSPCSPASRPGDGDGGSRRGRDERQHDRPDVVRDVEDPLDPAGQPTSRGQVGQRERRQVGPGQRGQVGDGDRRQVDGSEKTNRASSDASTIGTTTLRDAGDRLDRGVAVGVGAHLVLVARRGEPGSGTRSRPSASSTSVARRGRAERAEADLHPAGRRLEPDLLVHRLLLGDQLVVDVPPQPARRPGVGLDPVVVTVDAEPPDLRGRHPRSCPAAAARTSAPGRGPADFGRDRPGQG